MLGYGIGTFEKSELKYTRMYVHASVNFQFIKKWGGLMVKIQLKDTTCFFTYHSNLLS